MPMPLLLLQHVRTVRLSASDAVMHRSAQPTPPLVSRLWRQLCGPVPHQLNSTCSKGQHTATAAPPRTRDTLTLLVVATTDAGGSKMMMSTGVMKDEVL